MALRYNYTIILYLYYNYSINYTGAILTAKCADEEMQNLIKVHACRCAPRAQTQQQSPHTSCFQALKCTNMFPTQSQSLCTITNSHAVHLMTLLSSKHSCSLSAHVVIFDNFDYNFHYNYTLALEKIIL